MNLVCSVIAYDCGWRQKLQGVRSWNSRRWVGVPAKTGASQLLCCWLLHAGSSPGTGSSLSTPATLPLTWTSSCPGRPAPMGFGVAWKPNRNNQNHHLLKLTAHQFGLEEWQSVFTKNWRSGEAMKKKQCKLWAWSQTTAMNLQQGQTYCVASPAPTLDLWLVEITKSRKFVIRGFLWITKFLSQVSTLLSKSKWQNMASKVLLTFQ